MNPSRYIGGEGLLTLLPAVFIIILFGSAVLVMILSDPECMSASFLLHLLIALSPSLSSTGEDEDSSQRESS